MGRFFRRRISIEPKKYSFIHSMNQRIGATRLGAWFYARMLHPFDRAFFFLTGGRKTLSALLAGLPVVWVTTIGARSGRPRTVPIVCIPIDSDTNAFGLIASNFGQRHHPAWYHNMKANPQVICLLNGRTGEYIARETSGGEYDRIWERGVSFYAGYSLYRQRVGQRTIPIMALTPVPE